MAAAADIIRILEEIAPPALAETWDNSGLQLGSLKREVKKVMIALDPSPPVIAHAVGEGVDLLITHHPLFFEPIKSIPTDTPFGCAVAAAAAHGLVIYSAHTSLDAAPEGLNRMFADKIGLTAQEPLDRAAVEGNPVAGLGRIGRLSPPVPLGELCRRLKDTLGLENIRAIGDPSREVSRVALCTGSGGGLLDLFFASGADVYITGDIRYHDALKVRERNLSLIDVGHFGSEHIVVDALALRLSDRLKPLFPEIVLIPCNLEEDPFTFY